MNTLENVLRKYTLGEASKDETNDALQELSSPLRLDPGKNELTEEDIRATTVGHYPEQANGYGLMDHGVGCLEKVRVVAGRTVDVDMGQETAFVYIGGKCYRLRGDVLTEME